MFTIVALPKPFIGHIGVIQRNAIGSWLLLRPRPHVLLFGDEEGTAAAAREFGAEHIPEVERNAFGTPLLRSVFDRADLRSPSSVICYSNCDILLLSDFSLAVERAAAALRRFLLVGECTNLDVRRPLDFEDPAWEESMRREIARAGKPRGPFADFFVYTRGLYASAPPLALGRAYFDNWAIWKARHDGVPVIDGTGSITAVHQNHYYSAVPGEEHGKHKGIEAEQNMEAAGGRNHLYWIFDATHRLSGGKIRRMIIGRVPLRERWKRCIRPLWYFLRRPRA